MVQWVYEAAHASRVADQVLVATPDEEILEACVGFGAEAVLTRADHPSGTDRIAEVSRNFDADVFVNVQGDEPLVRPETIAACAQPLLDRPEIQMGSVFSECGQEELEDPSVVKVVTDREGFALYFSRHPIPFPRNDRVTAVKKHVGIYAYGKGPLQAFANWSMGDLERAESLEQLRFMENGVRIFMARGAGSELAVDTPEQAEQVRQILLARVP